MSSILVAPSILAADCLNFQRDITLAEKAGADWHHIDVMDGHFVPNLTFGIPLIKALKKVSKIPLDVHIMISNPDDVALSYVEAGADILVFHIETAKHAHRLVQAIRQAGAKPGIAVNPGTPIEWTFPLLREVDVVMLMSVNPGFGGQNFLTQTVDRVAALHREIVRQGRVNQTIIEVDGGLNATTASSVVAAGARVLVAGTYFYQSENYAAAVQALKSLEKSA